MGRPIFNRRRQHVSDRILCLVMDDELHGGTKSLNFEYFIVKDLESKYDLLKEAISSEKISLSRKQVVGGTT